MDPFSLTALAIGSAIAYSAFGRGKRRTRWVEALELARRRLDARLSIAQTPELRATVEGREVMLQVRDITKSDDSVLAISEAKLSSEAVRLFVGWDVTRIRDDIFYIPEVPFPGVLRLEGRVNARADDPRVAERFLTLASSELVDLRKSASARAVELLARGGTLRVAVHGLGPSANAIERAVLSTASLAGSLELAASGVDLPPVVNVLEKKIVLEPIPDRTLAADPECTLCRGQRHPMGGFVRCRRCRSVYHARCWTQATGCIAEGCDWIRAEPM